MKALCKIIILGFVAFSFVGCISAKSYVNPNHFGVTYSDIEPLPKPHKLKVLVEFQRNGTHIPQVDKELRGHVERVLRATGFGTPVDENSHGELKVTVNNIADIGKATAKGLGTGLTLGMVGTSVTDHYEMEANFSLKGKNTKLNDSHAIHSTVGNQKGPEGLEPMTASGGFGFVVEDFILYFIKKIQTEN